MGNKHYVYGLIDPTTKELRYIGYTRNIKQRIDLHCRQSKLIKNTHKNNWIKNILKNNKKPEIYIIEEHDNQSEALLSEIELIAYYKYIGANLTNISKGGELGIIYERTQEIKEKISKSCKGRKHTKETKNKISKTLTGFKRSEENCKNMSNALKGKYVGENSFSFKLSNNDILKIKELWDTKKINQTEIAKLFNVSRSYISDIVCNKKRS